MELVKILGVDASLRNTGLALVTYNTELAPNDPKAFQVSNCKVVRNPPKYTGTDAILNMLDMLSDEALNPCYDEVSAVLIESPPIMFNKKWSGGTVSLIAHISGGAAVVFGIDRAHLFRPNEWNKCRKKDVTHNNTIAFLGHPDTWHFDKREKNPKFLEHVLDATSMCLWWIKNNYIEEEPE